MKWGLLRYCALAAGLLGLAPGGAPAQQQQEPFVLAVQPVLTEAETQRAFQPLADFIAKSVGPPCVVRTRPNFLAYWDMIRKGEGYDLVLDAAHFTDYRIRKSGYQVLVKVPDTVSYSLIVLNSNPVFDPAELVARRIATLGTPSIGAARLNAMFPNPSRQPIAVEVASAELGIQMLVGGKVDAAILPTPIVSREMARDNKIMVVTTTEPIPHIALSVSPRIDAALRERIRKALLEADNNADGKAMLAKIGFPRFDPTTSAVYAGHANVLKEYWGF